VTHHLTEVPLVSLPTERFAAVMDPPRYAELVEVADGARQRFAGRVVWNVSSTARGGGVAEMLASLLSYTRGAGVDARWAVIAGTPPFFALTKRLHNRLHGRPGDDGPLGDQERRIYAATLEGNAAELAERVRSEDIVLLHDPQTLGLAAPLKALGATVVWRCHIGLDEPNDLARDAWAFLEPFAGAADAYVFSRAAYVWTGLDLDRTTIIRPGIDPLSAKNQHLDADTVSGILHACGLLDGQSAPAAPAFARMDDSPGRVDRAAWVREDRPLGNADRLVTQISRWDSLKDPAGVMRAFIDGIAPASDAHLLLAGPAVEGVTDDPEGGEVLASCLAFRETVAPEVRAQIHLACLPMQDVEENAAIVNALQRQSALVVQKSLAEGFGLTVAEAMWKARPVVASAVGGIRDQIVDGRSGLLIDPADLKAFAAAVLRLLADDEAARALGAAAHERVGDEFLAPRQLTDHVRLLSTLDPRR